MFTEEQQKIIDTIKSYTGNKIIGVNAIAGSGKTTTAKGIIDAVNPTCGLYTAFNKSVVEDAKRKLTGSIDVRTIHSLAYKYTNLRNIGDLTITGLFGSYKTKRETIDKINNFFVSKYTSFQEYCKSIGKEVTSLDKQVLTELQQGKRPTPFNYLLKTFHNALVNNSITYPEYDLLVLDECQDTSAVTLEIFKLLNAKKKVVLGDSHQNIYSFMNTVNAFTELNKDELEVYNLTKSFRCSEEIGNQVETYGKMYFNDEFKFSGTAKPPQRDGSLAILTKTNATLLQVMAFMLLQDKDFKIYRNPYDIAELPICLILISNNNIDKLDGNQVIKYQYIIDIYNEYKETADKPTQYNFFNYLIKETNYDDDISTSVNTIKWLNNNNINIFNLLKSITNKNTTSSKLSVSTVHTFKGLEADTVLIHNGVYHNLMVKDLQTCDEDVITSNVCYVALTRARYKTEIFYNVDDLKPYIQV